MGRSFCTIREAAARLGKSTRQIHNYIKDGLLTKWLENGKTFVYKEEVEQLAADRDSKAPTLTRKNFYLLMNRVSVLENQVRTLCEALQIRSEVLRPTPQEASGLYRGAVETLTKGKWADDEARMWATWFERMDEVTLESFCDVSQDSRAWVPFMRLCRTMLAFMEARSLQVANLEVQKTVESLKLGEIKLQTAVKMLIEMGRGVSVDTILALTENPKTALLHSLKT
jgi:hypothetical protein